MSRRKKILIGVIIAQILLGIGLVYYFFILEPKINVQRDRSIKRSPRIRKPRGNEAGGTIVSYRPAPLSFPPRNPIWPIGFISVLVIIFVLLYSLSIKRKETKAGINGDDWRIEPEPIGAREKEVPKRGGIVVPCAMPKTIPVDRFTRHVIKTGKVVIAHNFEQVKEDPSTRHVIKTGREDEGKTMPVKIHPSSPKKTGPCTEVVIPNPGQLIEMGGLNKIYHLHTENILIGREVEEPPNIKFPPEYKWISGTHARIKYDRQKKTYVIHNESTVIPMLVNAEDVKYAELNDGDIITLGKTELRFRIFKEESLTVKAGGYLIEIGDVKRRFELDRETILIGRDVGSKPNIELSYIWISGTHARINYDQLLKKYVIHSESTVIPVEINDEQVELAELNEGDIITLGKTKLQFHIEESKSS